MKISFPFGQNCRSMSLGSTNIASGARVTGMSWFYTATPFTFMSVWRSMRIVLFVKATVKMHFVKAFFPVTRLLLFALLPAILRPSPMNTGFYAIPSMDSATAHNISIKNHQNTQVHRSHSFHQEPCLFTGFVMDPCDPSTPASSTPLTLGLYIDDFPTSWQTLWWRHFSVVYLLSAVRSTLWEWSSGF